MGTTSNRLPMDPEISGLVAFLFHPIMDMKGPSKLCESPAGLEASLDAAVHLTMGAWVESSE